MHVTERMRLTVPADVAARVRAIAEREMRTAGQQAGVLLREALERRATAIDEAVSRQVL